MLKHFVSTPFKLFSIPLIQSSLELYQLEPNCPSKPCFSLVYLLLFCFRRLLFHIFVLNTEYQFQFPINLLMEREIDA